MNPDTLVAAKKDRQWQIKLLRACNCTYPIETLRNGSGHAGDCPAHALHEQRQTKRGGR